MLCLCPHLAAVERSLPRRVAEGQRTGSEFIRMGVWAEKVGDDLELLSEEAGEEGSFRASGVYRPRGGRTAFARGQADVSLSSHSVA